MHLMRKRAQSRRPLPQPRQHDAQPSSLNLFLKGASRSVSTAASHGFCACGIV